LLLILFWFFFWGTGVLYLLRQICGKNVVFPPFWQAEAASDDVYAQVSLVPESEVGVVLILL
jgi:hypothetical protein